jgi:threonine dehydrogenase-like Zn-dependent dehydrogenase
LTSIATDDARAFWIIGPGRGEIRPVSVPEPGDGDVLVRTLYSAISRGTEALVFRGAVPPSEYRRMRAPFQTGDFPAPVKFGYINVGFVERGPAALEGRTVFCLYPHQTRYVVPAEAVHVLPQCVPPARGVLAAYLETAVNALWDAPPRLGERIAVVGAGTLGCLVAWLASSVAGCRVELVDIEPGRRRAADALGVGFAAPVDAASEADLVVHTSGTQQGLSTALGLAGFEAMVLELSWYGDERVALPLGEAFHSRRLILRSSQVSAVAASQRARWTVQRRMELVLELLSAPELDVLITDEHPFDELPAVLAELSESGGQGLCHRIVYERP